MKFISAFLLVGFFAATAHGLGVIFNPLPPARYGPPKFLANLTSSLFNPNQTTGTSPLFDLLNTLTSNLYKPIANRINSAFFNNTGLGNALNYLTANIFGGGLCSFTPATTQSPMTWPGMPTTQGSATNNPTPTPSSIMKTILNMLGGKGTGGAGNPGSTGTSGGVLSTLLGLLKKIKGSSGSGSGSSSTNSIITNMIQKYINSLYSGTGTGTPGTGNSGTSGTGTSGTGTSGTGTSGTPGTGNSGTPGTGNSGSNTGNSPVPTIPSVSLEDLARQLNVSSVDLQSALNTAKLTPAQLNQALSDAGETHAQFDKNIVDSMNNIAAAIQSLLNNLAQKVSPDVHSVANALNTTAPGLIVAALQSGIPVSSLNDIMKALHLSIQAYLKIYTTTCMKEYPCFFQQLLNLYTKVLTGGSGSGSGNGSGLGDTLTNGLNDVGKKLGGVGNLLTSVVGTVLAVLGNLVKSLGL